ncbi:MAG: TonB-dependent receptor, partial [Bacteroidota bacterium]
AKRERIEVDRVVFGKPGSNSRPVVLSGLLRDKKTKEPLAGVGIVVKDIDLSGVSGADGRYAVSMPAGEHIISFSYLNYEDRIFELSISENGNLQVEMEETPVLLEEIVVEGSKAREITTSSIGQTQLSIRQLKQAPALLGEIDVIKQIQLLPGVTTAGEAASGYNVRGGSVDQNLVLYDGLPVFNSSHVFGFFSTFNAEAIRDVTFYRGGIPAEFGGRISSVLDIRSREGDYEKWGGGAGIGMVSSNVNISGPIKRNKTSVIGSLRTTYSDWLINTVRSNYVSLDKSSVAFYDGTFKISHKFSNRTKLTASGYGSKDSFRLQGDTTFSWKNSLASLRLDHQSKGALGSIFFLGYGTYGYDVFDKNPSNGFNLTYSITYPTAKADFFLKRNNHRFAFGVHNTLYLIKPGTLTPSGPDSNKKLVAIDRQQSLESAVYFSDQIDLSAKIQLDLGLRVSRFAALGAGDVYLYQQGVPRITTNVVDTLKYGANQTIKSYINPEPRLGFRYSLTENASLKFGYNRIFQYLHLVTNTTAVTPIDIWQPSGYYFKPQKVDQVSMGYFRNTADKRYEMFAELYYKKIDNVLDFKDGAQLILNPQIETDLLQGKARSYGIEVQGTKNSGKFTGSAGYTFSRTFRTIIGQYTDENINDGKEYPANFDQPHVVNVNWKLELNKRTFFTGLFTYRTGRPVTLPLTAFSYENFVVSSFSERNKYRMQDYHRLDLGLVIEGSHKRRKIWDGTWTISIYNVYGRRNPYSIFFKEARPGILRPYRLAIIGTALPSISYSLKF